MNAVKGIVPPVITPLIDEDTLDLDGLNKLVEHLISGGVHGLFILGTTGEGPSLSHSLRVELIQHVCKQVDDRLPVLVGITDASFEESIYISDKSKEFGAEAVVLAPPFYYQIDQNELYNYTNQLINEISLPVYLYDNPNLTKVSFGLEIVEKLISRSEVVGFKDSSGNMVNFQKLIRLTDRADISLLIGPEELLMEATVVGGNGGVPGGANIFPNLYVGLYEAVKNGKFNDALKFQDQIMELSEIVYSGSSYGSSSIINGIKSALKHLDICNDYISQPLKQASQEKDIKIKSFVTSQAG